MPGRLDGIGLVRLIRGRYPDVHVIVLSGAQPEKLQDVEADAILAKPHSATELIAHIRRLLGGNTSNGSRNSNARNS
jgi:DNA-binding response OmpR family regulator